jgi:hypothetical protein
MVAFSGGKVKIILKKGELNIMKKGRLYELGNG